MCQIGDDHCTMEEIRNKDRPSILLIMPKPDELKEETKTKQHSELKDPTIFTHKNKKLINMNSFIKKILHD